MKRMTRDEAFKKVKDELNRALAGWPPMNSAHEGLGILMEEFDELKDEIYIKQKNRDLDKMCHEACQLAAMSIRFMMEVCNEERGRR